MSAEKVHTEQSVGFHIKRRFPEQHCAEWESSRNVSLGMGHERGADVFFFLGTWVTPFIFCLHRSKHCSAFDGIKRSNNS
ncbi:hypothetical protein EXN66_Car014931 [Channa argus]|uniref:Uncharacterized protein n=1 Tax=Channa argus TaxID=215402 RepID=A0A6G1QA01_CHAAH|nr:hypothetical protein EXN66_Car014931 [Channa argus]